MTAVDAIPACPTSGEGVHTWLMEAAWRCRFNGMSPDQAAGELATRMTRRPSPPREIEQAVAKAYDAAEPTIVAYSGRPRTIKASYKPSRLEALARRMDGFSFPDLAARSPIRPDNRTPASFLHSLFAPGEQVLIFTTFQSQGQGIFTRPLNGEQYNATTLDKYVRPAEGNGTWFLSNPVDGQFRNIDRLKNEHNPTGRSRRAEANITSFRYLVIESDKADPALWLPALVQIPLPIVAIYSSGGKSIHSLVRVEAESGDHWREIKAKLAPALVTIGADDAAMTAVRLTRLPQCFRAEKDRWQELYYLNPTADETPIGELKTL